MIVFLQPSWTWNAINYRVFEGDSIRAIENVFTLLRWSSNGESGIVDPKGKFLARQYTGHNPLITSEFQFPLISHVYTVYTYFGVVFPWLCLFFSFIIYILTFIPMNYLKSYLNIQSNNNDQNIPEDLLVPFGSNV